MPECVEVEITRRKLADALLNRELCGVRVYDARLPSPAGEDLYKGRLLGISRKGKALRFDISGNRCFTMRLGMTGSLFVESQDSPDRLLEAVASKRPRVVLEFGDSRCVFIDPRRFGKLAWVSAFPKGWDILSAISQTEVPQEFSGIFKKSQAKIKNLLMDQNKIAGLGNIYANEILYGAGISPKRIARTLKSDEIGRLWSSSRLVLAKALQAGGISMRNFYHPDGLKGGFQKRFLIYGQRKGALCGRCRIPIKVFMLAQRSTFYCPGCQK